MCKSGADISGMLNGQVIYTKYSASKFQFILMYIFLIYFSGWPFVGVELTSVDQVIYTKYSASKFLFILILFFIIILADDLFFFWSGVDISGILNDQVIYTKYSVSKLPFILILFFIIILVFLYSWWRPQCRLKAT